MNVKLMKVKEEQKSILAHLIELYEYDFSEFEDNDVNAYGLYGYSYLDYYWTEAGRYAYFIQVDGKLGTDGPSEQPDFSCLLGERHPPGGQRRKKDG